MPCYDSRDRDPGYICAAERDEIAYLEGLLCAIFSELNMTGDWDMLQARCEKNAKIDFSRFIENHERKDRLRLRKDVLERYSVHEREIIKEIIGVQDNV